MQIQQDKTDEEKVLYDSTTPRVTEFTVEEFEDEHRVHALVSDGLSTQHFASEPLTEMQVTTALANLNADNTVKRTMRDDRAYFFVEPDVSENILFTKQTRSFPTPEPVETQLYQQGDGVTARIQDITQEDDHVVLTVIPETHDSTYTFNVAPEEYTQLLDECDAVTGEGLRIELTMNRSAHNITGISIENSDGVILTDKFSISPAYPLTRYRYSFLLLLSTATIGFYTMLSALLTTSIFYVFVFTFIFGLYALYLSMVNLKLRFSREELSWYF